ncbi:MAG TPA: hypothetical protein VFL42_02270 [Terriglobales bacterium]|nr:hypothetical protein [Terriglobales bacterium]
MHDHARFACRLAFAFFVLSFSCIPLRADVGLILSESIGGGINGWTGSGHAAIYFSNLCPDTPLKLRACGPGESGSVVSNYVSLGEDVGYEWNAVSPEIALYGVENLAQQPLLAWPALRQALQERYRQQYLPEICTGARCTSNPEAEWRDLVATTFVRDSYVFLAKTMMDQDLKVMQWLNSSPNINHYNGFTNNCADFAARVLNAYFPGSARPDHMNDFAITSPKAIAKSFTHYSRAHSALQFRVVRFTQIPGSYRASTDAKKGTEALFTSKRWLFPLLLRPHELAFFAGSYLLTGRFNPEHELRGRPSVGLPHAPSQALAHPLLQPVAIHDPLSPPPMAANAKSASAVLGSKREWNRYNAAFRELTAEAINKGLISSRIGPRRVIEMLGANGRISFDRAGAAWLTFSDEAGTRGVGLAADNINSRDSDPRFAYMIMLARVGAMLDRFAKNREPMPSFEQDWNLMLEARARLWPAAERVSLGSTLDAIFAWQGGDFLCCGLESSGPAALFKEVSCESVSGHAALRSAAASSCANRMK